MPEPSPSETAIRAMMPGLPLPVLLIGPDERIVALTPAAARLFGIDGPGRHYITALRQPAVLDAIEETLREGTVRRSRYLGSEGRRDTTWRVTAAPVTLETGRGAVLTFEDTTAVEEAGQMRRDFVANVSHELRTPLTALLGFIETLRGPARDDPAARDRFLGIMQQEAGRMSRLVEDLLSLGRVEQDERVRPTAPVDLGELIAGTMEVLMPVIRDAGLDLAIDLPEHPVTVPGDAGQLRQVLRNLVENAVKYGAAGKRIEVRLTAPGAEPALRTEGVRISVRDWGDGIAAHHVARLTERFYRVDSHRSRQVGGTGLGLAIVKHIVNRHRGRLRVDSEPGQGATFTVVLPLT